MVRKLIKVLLAGSMLIPTLGFTLGLGDIQLRSGLNQQLDAEIELLSVDSSEVDKIAVSLASYETFAKLGVDRPAILVNLNFEVLMRPSGAPYIKVKSKSLINEPFLDFLVEVKWPTGKVLREYTLLLEPPEMVRQEPLVMDAPQVYEEPSVAEASQPVEEPLSVVPEPLVSAPVDAAGEMAEGETTEGEVAGEEPQPLAEPSETTPSAPVEAVAQAEPEQPMGGSYPAATAEVEPAPSAAAELAYGPVKRNEALWRIANRMRPDDSVSVEQMMIALFNANRGAFIQGNINRLRKGAVLRIEDPAALRALSHAEARREVARHGRAWEEYRSRVAAKTPDSAPAAETQEPAKAGAAVAAAPVKEEPKLSLVAPQQKGDTGKSAVGGTDEKGVGVESLRKDLLLATESAEARRKENEELNKRLKELEGQLDKMQKLLTLKSDELTAMQQKLGSQPAPGAAAPVEQAPPPAQPALVEPSPTEPPAVSEEVKVPETAPAVGGQPSAAGETPATTGAEAPVASDAAAPAEIAPAVSEGAKPEAAQAPATPAAPVKPKPTVPKPPKPIQPIPEPSLIDKVLNDPLLLGGGAAGLLILLLAIMMVIKKSRQGRGFQESILTVGATSSMMKGKGDNPASETSFLSDLAISGMGGRVQEESDVDPLKEADVYLTFNKFQPAEELLKEGIRHNPERNDLHAKLLEVYYKSKNREAFEAHATERAAALQKNEPQWQKIVAMGHELAPNNALFAGAAAASGAALLASATNPEFAAASEVFDIGLDLDALSSEMEAAGSAGSDFNVDLGLDFSDLGGEGEADQQKADESTTESANLDFDLSGFGMETDAPQPVASEPVQAEESLLGGLDFDLSAMAEETPVSEEPAALDFGDFDLGAMAQESTPEAENTIDFGSLDFGGSEELTGSAAPGALDFGDFDLGSSAGDASMDIADLGDMGDMGDLGDMSSFGSTDEIGTKLDLAKAYVDMGDAEGARSMLEEVIQEGSADQMRQAKELLSQIA